MKLAHLVAAAAAQHIVRPFARTDSLLELHRNLVEIPSVSGLELDVANWLHLYLEEAGLTVEKQRVLEKRYNVYAYVGSQRDTDVLLTSHIDTVPPFLPYKVEGSRIYGRGTCDAKGSVASQIAAVLAMREKGDVGEGDVALLYVVGEEDTGIGMTTANALGARWQHAVFGEPTELRLGVGHKGMYIFDFEVVGRALHSGYPELGVSATESLVPLLSELQGLQLPEHPLLGPSTINVGQISAGVAANVVPAHAHAVVAIRVADNLAQVVEKVKTTLAKYERAALLGERGTEPQFLDYEVPGFESIVLAYTTDIPNLHLELRTRHLYGPGSIHVAHGDNEYVEKLDLFAAVEGYERLVKHLLRKT